MNIDYDYWNLFWNAFGAIGGTVGSIATAVAVIVALWQTKVAYNKKVKLSLDTNTKIVSSEGDLVGNLVSLTITNTGNRDIVFTGWGIELVDSTEMRIMSNVKGHATGIMEMLAISFPYSLTIEQSLSLYYERKLFQKLVLESCNKKELHPQKPITFFVIDSTGKRYSIMTKEKAESYLPR